MGYVALNRAARGLHGFLSRIFRESLSLEQPQGLTIRTPQVSLTVVSRRPGTLKSPKPRDIVHRTPEALDRPVSIAVPCFGNPW